jgi:transcriptional regulator with XRE-family HTH domain
MTQQYLGMKIGIPLETVSKWETDRFKPTFNNIRNLLNVFDMTFEEFAKGVEIE